MTLQFSGRGILSDVRSRYITRGIFITTFAVRGKLLGILIPFNFLLLLGTGRVGRKGMFIKVG